MELILRIIDDIKDTSQYWKAGAYIGAGVFVGALILSIVVYRRLDSRKNATSYILSASKSHKHKSEIPINILFESIALGLFGFYITIAIERCFMRDIGSKKLLNAALFSTWNDDTESKALFIENILLFIPFGFLLPICIEQARKLILYADNTSPDLNNGQSDGRTHSEFLFYCIIPGLTASLIIETLQYILAVGKSELDDVITNAAGCVVGYIIYKLCATVANHDRSRG